MRLFSRWMLVTSLLLGSVAPEAWAQSPKPGMMQRIRSVVSALNAPAAEFEAYAEKNFAPAYLAGGTRAERLKFIEELQERLGKISASDLRREAPTRVVIAISGDKGTRGELVLEHELSDPFLITRLALQDPRREEAAATPPPSPPRNRQVANVVAALIEETFVDAARAAEIARALRARASAGEFDSIPATALDDALTSAMHAVEHDKHLSVDFVRSRAGEPLMTEAEALARLAEIRRAGPGAGSGFGPGPEQRRRNNYDVRAVEHLSGNVGYLRIDAFHDLSLARDTITAAMAVLDAVDAMIIDLRTNHGGANSSVIYLASYFMPKDGRVLITSRRRSAPQPVASRVVATPSRNLEEVPLYILTSSETFSAGEAFAYILQQFGRATVIGETTAGGGRPNAELPVGGGYTLSVSVGAVEHPGTGVSWQGVGVIPDIAVPAAEARTRAERAALEALAAKNQTRR